MLPKPFRLLARCFGMAVSLFFLAGAGIARSEVLHPPKLSPMSEATIRAKVVGKQWGTRPTATDTGPMVLYPNGIAVQFGGFAGFIEQRYRINRNEVLFQDSTGSLTKSGFALYRDRSGHIYARGLYGDHVDPPVLVELVELTGIEKGYKPRLQPR